MTVLKIMWNTVRILCGALLALFVLALPLILYLLPFFGSIAVGALRERLGFNDRLVSSLSEVLENAYERNETTAETERYGLMPPAGAELIYGREHYDPLSNRLEFIVIFSIMPKELEGYVPEMKAPAAARLITDQCFDLIAPETGEGDVISTYEAYLIGYEATYHEDCSVMVPDTEVGSCEWYSSQEGITARELEAEVMGKMPKYAEKEIVFYHILQRNMDTGFRLYITRTDPNELIVAAVYNGAR